MILYIDTHHGDSSTLALAERTGDILYTRIVQHDRNQSIQLLPAVDALLHDAQHTLADITGIGVVQGPGGFTALRIGISTANTLGFALHIPVVGVMYQEGLTVVAQLGKVARALKQRKPGLTLVLPKYGRAPNITKPKKRKSLGLVM